MRAIWGVMCLAACGEGSRVSVDAEAETRADAEPSVESIACTQVAVTIGASTQIYRYALVDVGTPEEALAVRVLRCEPVGALTAIPTTCPGGATCTGQLLPSPVTCSVADGGLVTQSGQLVVYCGDANNYWRSVRVIR